MEINNYVCNVLYFGVDECPAIDEKRYCSRRNFISWTW